MVTDSVFCAEAVGATQSRLGALGRHFAGLYFMDVAADPRPTIEFYSFATRRVEPVLTLDERPARHHTALSATADDKTLYYTQHDRQSVIKMIEFGP